MSPNKNTSNRSNNNECFGTSSTAHPNRNGAIPLTLLLQDIPFLDSAFQIDNDEDAMSVCSDISQDDDFQHQQRALPHLARRRNSSQNTVTRRSLRDSRWAADETTSGTTSAFSFPRQDSIPRRYTRTTSTDSDAAAACQMRPAERSATGRDVPFTAPIRSRIEDTIQNTIDILDEALAIVADF